RIGLELSRRSDGLVQPLDEARQMRQHFGEAHHRELAHRKEALQSLTFALRACIRDPARLSPDASPDTTKIRGSGAVLDASGRLGASFSASPKKTMLCRPVMLRPQVHVEH